MFSSRHEKSSSLGRFVDRGIKAGCLRAEIGRKIPINLIQLSSPLACSSAFFCRYFKQQTIKKQFRDSFSRFVWQERERPKSDAESDSFHSICIDNYAAGERLINFKSISVARRFCCRYILNFIFSRVNASAQAVWDNICRALVRAKQQKKRAK